MRRGLVLSLLLPGLLLGCEESDFAGATKACTPDGEASISLLSDEVENGRDGNYILYEITLKKICDAQLEETSAILFDINGEITSAGADVPIKYEITSDKEKIASGNLITVDGEDLFGNEGEEYLHSATDEEITFEIAKSGIQLRLELGGVLYMPPGSKGEFAGGDTELETYLRFGRTKTVEKTVPFVDGPSFSKDD